METNAPLRLLVVDDEEPFRRLLKKELTRKGFVVEVAAEGAAALKMLAENLYDVVLLDIVMPGLDGMSVMRQLREDPASPPVIVITGKATIETAVDAMKEGAYDYLTKPYKLDDLEIIVNRACEYRRLRFRSELLNRELVRRESAPEMLGSSVAIRDVLDLIRKISPTDSTVLIQGDSGTGKELVANTIWKKSRRSGMPFIALNCAALSANLMESELFGHEKGAFTTAYQTKYGIVEAADRGTLFLDEIAEMDLGLQAKLLRFMDSGEFRRVGGNKTLKVNVRVIAATNKSLIERVQAGRFREDLYYRLKVITLDMPPLSARKGDIRELAAHFVSKYASRNGKRIEGISSDAMRLLQDYDWPGNVRELENEMERAVILCDSGEIRRENLSVVPAALNSGNINIESNTLLELEKEQILKVLQDTGGNRTRASEILGINRKTLYLKLKKYGIENS